MGNVKQLQVSNNRIGALGTAFAKCVRSMTWAGQAVAGASLFVMMWYITIDVCGRYFFGAPLKGTLEVSSQVMLLMVVVLGLGYTHTSQANIRIELFVGRWSPTKQAIAGLVYSLVAIGFLTLLIRSGIMTALDDLRGGLYTDQLHIPVFPFRLMIPIGAALMLLEQLIDFFRQLNQVVKKM